MCEFCNETKNKEIISIKMTMRYENPEAYGYPEIVYWDEQFKLNKCPICHRELKNIKE